MNAKLVMRSLASLLLLLFTAVSAQAQPHTTDLRVGILSTTFVMEHKFRQLEQRAGEQGIVLRWSQLDREDQEGLDSLFDGVDLIIVDAPRGDDQSVVQSVAGDRLASTLVPVVHINRMTPQRRLWAERVELDLAERLAEYYLAGTQVNHDRLFIFIDTWLKGGDLHAVPPPQPLPDGGIYHPDLPDKVVGSLSAYLDWWNVRAGSDSEGRPVIGIETTSSYIADGQTLWMDQMIDAIEDQQGMPLMFYRSSGNVRPINPEVMNAASEPGLFPNPAEPAWQAGDDPIITLDGRLLPDVLMVNTFLGSNPEGRKAWYQHMGIPVMNILNYRGGALDDYLPDTAGVDSFSIPFSLTTAEYIGMIDPVVLNTNESGEMQPVPGHIGMLVDKAFNISRLKSRPYADKRLALFFWNHPPGEHNMGASNLNVPRSLEALTQRLADEGYGVNPIEEQALIDTIATMLRPGWRGDGFEQLLSSDLWDFLPLDHYQHWFGSLPESVKNEVNNFFGPPETSYWVIEHEGRSGFVIPRLQLGHLVILPQPMRGEPGREDEDQLYHDTEVPLNHAYLATYLWAREQLGVDAIIHFGTHGSQEWTPGKERGLWVHDYPNLLVGNVPVIYPYIVDNIGEAIHVKRRGRGVIVSHQTPPFSPAGLSDDFVVMNDLIREYQQLDEGLVKANNRELIIEQAVRMNIHQDMGWSVADLYTGFEAFLRDIEDYLEELGMAMQPLGLHTFGQKAEPDHLASTLMQMLGEPFYQALGYDDPGELFRIDYREMQATEPFRFVRDHILEGSPPDDETRLTIYEQGRTWLERLSAEQEVESVLHSLNGAWIDPSYGGDPIRNPDALPTGRNMYGFDPGRVPTRAAWDAGQEALEGLLLAHHDSHGQVPEKLAFTLWSTETMRHLGMLEAQILQALGVRPVWDRGGRVVDMELIPIDELGRPRIDVVISLTGLYRDQFPIVMERLNQAIRLVADADESAALNPLRRNTLALRERLLALGMDAPLAEDQALTRLFGNESGDYGTGLPDATLASDRWEEGDGQLAEIYLSRMSWGYGPDTGNWSSKPSDVAGQSINMYAEQLRGVDAAVFSRSSNLRGLLDTDHPFEYLGGISLAVQHLEGRSPELYISNMRDPMRARLQTAERFLATELRAVYQHPNWLKEMQNEGYAGTLQLLNTINNFWGWQTMDREVVRDDQWDEFHATYVMDRYELGIREWFEDTNPAALAQITERMLEAARKGYWQASEQTLQELVETYVDLAQRHDLYTPNQTFTAYVDELATGFGLGIEPAIDLAQPSPESIEQPAKESDSPAETVLGQRLEQVEPVVFDQQEAAPVILWYLGLVLALGVTQRAWLTHRYTNSNFIKTGQIK